MSIISLEESIKTLLFNILWWDCDLFDLCLSCMWCMMIYVNIMLDNIDWRIQQKGGFLLLKKEKKLS